MKSEKNISDYLHLYLGCEVMDLYNNKVGTLIGVSTKEILVQHSTSWGLSLGEVKPILRRLSSMTDEECIEIAQILGIGKDRYEVINQVNQRLVLGLWASEKADGDKLSEDDLIDDCDSCEQLIRICFKPFAIYKGLEHDYNEMYEFHVYSKIWHHLLSKRFWLFGDDWFDEGLIIDKETVK